MNYKQITALELQGQNSAGIKVLVALDREVTKNEYYEIAELAENFLRKTLLKNSALQDPEKLKIKEEMTKEILGCFPDTVTLQQKSWTKENISLTCPAILDVEEIPNEYCKDYCCVHKPWFNVKTPQGTIKIGWRKRVINITWPEGINKNGNELFPNEDVTKYTVGNLHTIHAWGYDKAKEYLAKILNTVPN